MVEGWDVKRESFSTNNGSNGGGVAIIQEVGVELANKVRIVGDVVGRVYSWTKGDENCLEVKGSKIGEFDKPTGLDGEGLLLVV